MTDTIERKALALVNEACKSDFKHLGDTYRNNILDALLLAIERHEQFAQEVSDAVTYHWPASKAPPYLSRFIIAKPDPLVEVCYSMGLKVTGHELREALAARGLEITEKKP